NIEDTDEYNSQEIPGNCLEGPLSLKEFTNLKVLMCSGQNITSLDLSGYVNLRLLSCGENQLTKLDVSSCSNLELLNCKNNKLERLDLSNCSQLTKLLCRNNQLTRLTLPTKLPNLEILACQDNLLTNLDFAALNEAKLTALNLRDNNFPAQDLIFFSKFTNLKELYLGNYSQTKINHNICNH